MKWFVAVCSCLWVVASAEVEVVDVYNQLEQPKLELAQRVARLEKRLSAQQQLELLSRIDELQKKIQLLQGQLELQAYQIKQLKQPQTIAVEKTAPTQFEDPITKTSVADDKQLYSQVYALLKDKQFDEARVGFEDFINRYPTSAYRDNAFYWLGEIQLKAGDYDQAFASFAHILDDYPKSGKAPGALLKQGYIYYDLGQWTKARQILEKLRKRYPSSASASLAQKRLQQMNSTGL